MINDGPVTIIANEIQTDDNTGINKLWGNAIYKDTAQGVSVLANYIESDKNNGSFLLLIRGQTETVKSVRRRPSDRLQKNISVQ